MPENNFSDYIIYVDESGDHSLGLADKEYPIVVEQRGKKEDEELELEFIGICDRKNLENKRFTFEIIMANKMSNSAGLQLADLVARPIGLSVLRPFQTNRAFETIKEKVEDVGLKIYP